jgi:hypothetical protein
MGIRVGVGAGCGQGVVHIQTVWPNTIRRVGLMWRVGPPKQVKTVTLVRTSFQVPIAVCLNKCHHVMAGRIDTITGVAVTLIMNSITEYS